MNLNPRIPLSLRFTAWLLMLSGVLSLVGFLAQELFRKSGWDLGLALGSIWIFAGLGLLRLSKGWRLLSIIGLFLEAAILVVIVFSIYRLGMPPQGSIFGVIPITVSRPEGTLMLLILSLVLAFQLSVLLSPSVRKCFDLKPVSGLTLRSTRTPPVLPFVLSQLPAFSASFSASVQAGPG